VERERAAAEHHERRRQEERGGDHRHGRDAHVDRAAGIELEPVGGEQEREERDEARPAVRRVTRMHQRHREQRERDERQREQEHLRRSRQRPPLASGRSRRDGGERLLHERPIGLRGCSLEPS
jgi:hypothetical protein